MPIAKCVEHFMTSWKVVHEGKVGGGDSFFYKPLKGNVVRDPDVVRFRVKNFVRAGERTV